MKIYVVTTGCYSDYEIRRVFLDKNKAEEYSNWLVGSNPVEEYDTSDDSLLFENDINNKVTISANLCWPEEFIRIDKFNDDFFLTSKYNNVILYNHGKNSCSLIVRKLVNKNFDKSKIEKYLYDMKAFILSLEAEGYNERQINKILNDKED